MERMHREGIGRATSCEIAITEFFTEGDRAYLAGYVSGSLGKLMLVQTAIIKESGEWKWYGNQRDVAP